MLGFAVDILKTAAYSSAVHSLLGDWYHIPVLWVGELVVGFLMLEVLFRTWVRSTA
jgi:hypothetical protein